MAADQVFAAEVYEELTDDASGWSPGEYERWLNERLREVLLEARREPRSSG